MAAHDEKARLAEGVLANRRERVRWLPQELFGEYPWDALLMLFVADAQGRRMTGNGLVDQMGCMPRVMAQWLKHLSQAGLIVGDGKGDLTDEITISASALLAIEGYLNDTRALAQRFVNAGEFDAIPPRRRQTGDGDGDV